MSSIICGKCGETHGSTATVRACYEGRTFPCGWLIELYGEDGAYVEECGAASFTDARGYACEAGHSYVYTEVRMAERWDYAADQSEAYLLRKYGVDAVAMDGSAI